MDEGAKVLVDGWLSISGWLSGLILSGAGLCAIVTVLRLTGKDTVRVKDIDVPLDKFWAVAIVYTIGHLFLTWSFLLATDRILSLPFEVRKIAWTKLTVGNNLLFSGMEPRTIIGQYIVIGTQIKLYEMHWDPSSVLSMVFCVVLFTAVAHKIRPNLLGYLDAFIIGFIFCLTNWILGALWSIAASKIAG